MDSNKPTYKERSRIVFCYSEEAKCVLWMPPRTASTHASYIATLFDFVTTIYDTVNKKIVMQYDMANHHHELSLPLDFEADIICTARNPYKRMISWFFLDQRQNPNLKWEFREFFKKKMNEPFFFFKAGMRFGVKEPKYFIRQEHLYQDWTQIPSVRDSIANQCGVLEKLCSKRINKTKVSNNTSDYYTQDMADELYYQVPEYFDRLGYHKDSWKD